MTIHHLYVSAGHNYFGHHGRPAGRHPTIEVPGIECVAGRGIRGDRFFDFKENYRGHITFFAAEVHAAACRHLGLTGAPPSVLRRNVVTTGVDLNALIGVEFEVQGVHFRGMGECAPCYWMDQALGPGAEAFLRGRGGLRAVILTSGRLCVDAA